MAADNAQIDRESIARMVKRGITEPERRMQLIDLMWDAKEALEVAVIDHAEVLVADLEVAEPPLGGDRDAALRQLEAARSEYNAAAEVAIAFLKGGS